MDDRPRAEEAMHHLAVQRASFEAQQAQMVQTLALSQHSREEYDTLLAEYYTLRVRHQTDMLRLNQVLYLNSQGPGESNPQQATDMAVDEPPRPVLVGINTNMQVKATSLSKKRTLGCVEEEDAQKTRRCRANERI